MSRPALVLVLVEARGELVCCAHGVGQVHVELLGRHERTQERLHVSVQLLPPVTRGNAQRRRRHLDRLVGDARGGGILGMTVGGGARMSAFLYHL